MINLKNRVSKLISLIKKPEMGILPGHLAFFLVLSIVPIILLFVVLASHFSVSTDVFVSFINNHLPSEVAATLLPFLSDSQLNFNTSFLVFIGIVLASNGLYSVIVASNTLYGEVSPNFWKRRVKAVILTIVLLVLFVFMIVVMAFGDNIMLFLKDIMRADLIYDYINYLYVIIKWPFAFIYIFFVINLIYTAAPDYKIKSRSALYGSIFTTLTWIIATYGYSFYVVNIAKYNLIYGSLSSIIVMMIWIYILSYLFIIGLAINVSRYVKIQTVEEEVSNEQLN